MANFVCYSCNTLASSSVSASAQPRIAPRSSAWKELAAYANLGMTIAVAFGGCGLLGWWIDQHLHSSPIGLLSGLTVGCAVALREIWKVVRKLNASSEGHHP
ncbi:MAG: AtpZ/AtpI family protein [Chlorobiota bacterium]